MGEIDICRGISGVPLPEGRDTRIVFSVFYVVGKSRITVWMFRGFQGMKQISGGRETCQKEVILF